jgi:hypothetical protein
MKWDKLLSGIVKDAGVAGVKKVEGALDDLSAKANKPWKKAVMGLLGDAVEKYGLDGVQKVEKALQRLGEGKQPDIEFASLKARSDFLAAMQNMEADEKSKAKDFFSTIGESLGIILKAVIAGLMSA